MSEENSPGPGELPVVDGSIYGAAAYLAGYLVTLVLVVIFEGQRFIGDVIEGAGWIYYNAQFVSIDQRATPAAQAVDGVGSINYLTGEGLGEIGASPTVVPSIAYHAIPVIVFFTAGFLLTRAEGVEMLSTGAKVGASIVFGVAVLALGGTFVFEVANAIGPNRFQGILLAGIIYPVVCGAVGGCVSVWVTQHVKSADASKPF